MYSIPIINGPNLNLTGLRQIEIYGNQSFDDYLMILKKELPEIEFRYFQSNHEGELVDVLHSFRLTSDAIIFNPGAYTHTSVALRDAVASVPVPVAEVHLTSIRNRESFRRTSLIQEVCYFQISGYGLESYKIASLRLLEFLKATSSIHNS